MRSVGIKALKNNLSEYVRLASQGETVLVTDRDRVVAELTPPRVERSPMLNDALLADLVRNGVLVPALERAAQCPPRYGLAKGDTLLRELADDRSER